MRFFTVPTTLGDCIQTLTYQWILTSSQVQAQPVQINVCCLAAVLMMMTQEETYVVSCLLSDYRSILEWMNRTLECSVWDWEDVHSDVLWSLDLLLYNTLKEKYISQSNMNG